MSDVLIAWGKDRLTGAPRHITEVRTGLACGCICAGCRSTLEAVNSENPNARRRPYFRHYELPETGDCAVGARLAAVRHVLEGSAFRGPLHLPEYTARVQRRDSSGHVHTGVAGVPAETVRVQSVAFLDETYALLTLDDGRAIHVLLVARSQQQEPDMPVGAAILVLDLTGREITEMSPRALRSRLQLLPDCKGWRRHFRQKELVAAAEEQVGGLVMRADQAEEQRAAAHRFTPAPGRYVPERHHTEVVPAAPPVPPSLETPTHAWAAIAPAPANRQVLAWQSAIWPDVDWSVVLAVAAASSESMTAGQAIDYIATTNGARAGVVRDFLRKCGWVN